MQANAVQGGLPLRQHPRLAGKPGGPAAICDVCPSCGAI